MGSAGLELVAGLLLLTPAALLGAYLAIALLIVFTLAMLRVIARGEHPECHCFGALHSAPVGWKTVVRNLLLICVAVLAAYGYGRWPASQIWDWLGEASRFEVVASALLVVLVGAVALEAWAILAILRQNGRLLLRLDAMEEAGEANAGGHRHAGLALLSDPPAFSLPDVDGRMWTLDELRPARKRLLLIFSDPSCAPCTALMPEVAGWQKDLKDQMIVVLISRGTVQANKDEIERFGLANLLIQEDDEVATAFGYQGTPGAVLIGAEGKIATQLVSGADPIRALVRTTCNTAPTAVAAAPALGDPAPNVKLPSLDGEELELRSFRGREVVLLFWDPACGFCDRMLPDLQAWDRGRSADAPALLVVSSGSVDDNASLELGSPVLLDPIKGKVMNAFGASGTPMAVRVDPEGSIGSTVQIGAGPVLRLLSHGE
jgi:peroxiredoxin